MLAHWQCGRPRSADGARSWPPLPSPFWPRLPTSGISRATTRRPRRCPPRSTCGTTRTRCCWQCPTGRRWTWAHCSPPACWASGWRGGARAAWSRPWSVVALSLGKDLVVAGHRLGPGPYRLLYRFVPVFHLMRIPERFGLLAMLFLALLVGSGISLVRARPWPVAAAALAAVVPLEHVSVCHPTLMPVGDHVPRVYRWLAAHPAGAVAEVPSYGEHWVRRETLEMYFSTYHWQPIIHGYTAYQPAVSRALRACALRATTIEGLQCLQRWRVDRLIVHWPPGGDPEQAGEWLSARPRAYYRQVRALEKAGALVPLATFEGAEARAPGSKDVVYRVSALEGVR